ncbi:hypothetical protein PQX77_001202, partial [Marasmius sp. AFHP31]
MTTATPQSFSIDCFSVDDQHPYQLACIAQSFHNKHCQLWLKTHAAMERGFSTAEGEGYIYVFRIEGVDFSDGTDRDLSNTATYK